MGKWFCVTDFTNAEPEKPGCYAIYTFNVLTSEKKLIYIGTAVNLYQRLKRHEVKRVLFALIDYPEFVYIKCRIEENTSLRKKLEVNLINKLKPKANR